MNKKNVSYYFYKLSQIGLISLLLFCAKQNFGMENNPINNIKNNQGKLLTAINNVLTKNENIVNQIKLAKDNTFYILLTLLAISPSFFTEKISLQIIYPLLVLLIACSSINSSQINYTNAIMENDFDQTEYYSKLLGTNFSINQFSPIILATLQNRLKSMEAILNRYDCVIDEKDENGYTAADHALEKGYVKALELLIKYKAKFNVDNTIETYIDEEDDIELFYCAPAITYCALDRNKLAMFKFLLSQGADLLIPDSENKTIFDYMQENPEIKHAHHIKAIIKQFKKTIALIIQDNTNIIPDLANIIAEYSI